MKILLATLGTAGDIHPFVAIGMHLRAAGQRVELLTNPVFEPLARQAGLDFHGVGSADDFHAAFAHPLAWHPIKGLGVLWRHLTRRALDASYRRIAAVHAKEGCTVLYSPLLMPAPRIAQEALGVRAISCPTAPAMIRSHHSPQVIGSVTLPRGTPSCIGRLGWAWLDRAKMQPLALPDLERLRGPLGLPPIRDSVFGCWMHSPDRGIALFPAWFAAPMPDWPRNLAQAGFPLYDGDATRGLGATTIDFLAAGNAPLVFTAGSAMRHAADFFAAAVRLSRTLGRRAILLTADTAQVPVALPATVLHSTYEPFGALLPRAAALVHHGGIGTSAQALRAGIPQLLLPQAYDQFDNALRLQRLGVGTRVRALDGAAPALSRLLHEPAVQARCAAAARQLAADTPMRVIDAALGIAA